MGQFVEYSYTTVLVTLKGESALSCPAKEEFKRFELKTLDTLLERIGQERGEFIVRRKGDRRFVVIFEKSIVAELSQLVERLRYNEHVEGAEGLPYPQVDTSDFSD